MKMVKSSGPKVRTLTNDNKYLFPFTKGAIYFKKLKSVFEVASHKCY